MNRRRLMSSIHRSLARNAAPVVASVDHSTIERMPIADLDRIGPRLVTSAPVEKPEPDFCAYGCGALMTTEHAPFCSSICAINAEHS